MLKYWRMENKETIAAISTPPGRGGVAVVRVSGASAFEVASRLTGRLVDASLAGRFFHSTFFKDLKDLKDLKGPKDLKAPEDVKDLKDPKDLKGPK